MATTNVTPKQLNYDHYSAKQYDRDIVNSIPGYQLMHAAIADFFYQWRARNDFIPKVLDLGVGTGTTSLLMKSVFPKASLTAVDFSRQMIKGARAKLGTTRVKYVIGDYAKIDLGQADYDIVMSVIGLHHQTDQGKRIMFKKIRSVLKPGGAFVFGDLMTQHNPYEAASNDAKHYHHLVQNAADEQTLKEWAYHHMFMNLLTPIEDQLGWLRQAGFTKVKTVFRQLNTALIIAS